MNKIIEAVKKGTPIYLEPYREPKVWGVGGIGEYWYGAEAGKKSSVAVIENNRAPMAALIDALPEEVLGEGVIASFGRLLPLVKILTPKGRLSVQFHDAKNELWVITGIDASVADSGARIIIGFDPAMIKKYKDNISREYRKSLDNYGKVLNDLIGALEEKGHSDTLVKTRDVLIAALKIKDDDPKIKEGINLLLNAGKELDRFYNYVEVKIGDVIPVPQGTLHALGPGIEVVEPQIPGPTQSLEDGATYPVRYYFPGYSPDNGGKELDLDRIDEMSTCAWEPEKPGILHDDGAVRVERLPGGFENKGMAVDRITMASGAVLDSGDIKSYHTLVAVKGLAKVTVKGRDHDIPRAVPGGSMILIPAIIGSYSIKAETDSQIIDTYTPV